MLALEGIFPKGPIGVTLESWSPRHLQRISTITPVELNHDHRSQLTVPVTWRDMVMLSELAV